MANGLLVGLNGYWEQEVTPVTNIPNLATGGAGEPIVNLAGTSWSNVTGKRLLSVSQGTDLGNRAGIASPSDMNVTSDFTLRYWIKRATGEWSDGSTDPIYGVWNDTTGKSWYTIWNPGPNVFQCGVSQDGTGEDATAQAEVSGGGDPADGVFQHVVCGYDSTSGPFVQVNGGTRNNVLGQSLTGAIFSSSVDFGVMQLIFSGQRNCTGQHDEVAFWDRALSSDDAIVDYNSGGGLFFADFDAGVEQRRTISATLTCRPVLTKTLTGRAIVAKNV